MAEEKRPDKYRISGANYEGRFASVVAKPDVFEVRAMPIIWMILSLWVFATLFFFAGTFTGSVTVALLMTLLGGAFGCLGVFLYYPGRLLRRFSYGEIVSFVLDNPELAVNLKNNQMISVRLSEKKQQRLMLYLVDVLELGGEYHFERNGQYFRVKPNAVPEPEAAAAPGTPPKKKKAIEAQKAREAAAQAAETEKTNAASTNS